jgi:UDP-N-acetylmuramoyl-tripeptide--D-alanyl-D-alanine ligase
MEHITAGQIAAWCEGRILCGDPEAAVTAVCVDSRQVQAGSMFVAMPGERVDGHDYIEKAAAAGASCVICEKEMTVDGCCVILVENSLKALQMAARGYRKSMDIRCVAVTGSVGKTTTKEFLYAVLSSRYHTLKTRGNLNSDSGMPLMAFELTKEHEAAVFEMGMNHKGEIAALTKVGKPDLAVITNIGVSHIEHLGSRHNILYAKLEIERGLGRNGVMILNGDDDLLRSMAGKLKHKTVYFGIDNKKAQYRAENICEGDGVTEFDAVTPAGTCRARIGTVGRHNVLNAMAAVTVGLYNGISLEQSVAALLRFENAAMRQNIYEYNGITVHEDCYNASPDSMKAAFSTLANHKGRRVAVIADMLELGKFAKQMHETVGGYAVGNCDILITYGENSAYYRQAAEAAGMAKANIYAATDATEAGKILMGLVRRGDAVLFKGSRGLHTEKVLEILKEEWNG